MELIKWFVDLVLHLDVHLVELLRAYGAWVYVILFAIVFAETGFVVTPFLRRRSAGRGGYQRHAVGTDVVAAAGDRRGRGQYD